MVDTETDMPVWTTYWDLGIRPMTFDTNPDGSTRRIYAQLSNLNGFGVLDFDTRKEVDRIEYPDVPADQRTPGHGGNTAHGIGVTPDNRYLVANSSLNSSVYVYSLPGLELVGGVRVGHSPNWVTMTPDSRFAYISHPRHALVRQTLRVLSQLLQQKSDESLGAPSSLQVVHEDGFLAIQLEVAKTDHGMGGIDVQEVLQRLPHEGATVAEADGERGLEGL